MTAIQTLRQQNAITNDEIKRITGVNIAIYDKVMRFENVSLSIINNELSKMIKHTDSPTFADFLNNYVITDSIFLDGHIFYMGVLGYFSFNYANI